MTDAQWALVPILALALAVPLAAAYNHRAAGRWHRLQARLAFRRPAGQLAMLDLAMRSFSIAASDIAIAMRPLGDEHEHVALADALRAASATVVLSGYRSPLYDELYAGWHVATMRATSGQVHGTGDHTRTEVVWSNRPIGGGA